MLPPIFGLERVHNLSWYFALPLMFLLMSLLELSRILSRKLPLYRFSNSFTSSKSLVRAFFDSSTVSVLILDNPQAQ
jgi:hypothetical protein